VVKTILLDCDGPISDFVGHTLNTYHAAQTSWPGVNRSTLKRWEIVQELADIAGDQKVKTYLHAKVKRPGWCADMPPIPGAREAVPCLLDTPGLNVLVVTAPWDSSIHWMRERRDWLEKHCRVPARRVVFASDEVKPLIRGDVFLDDKPSTVAAWAANHRDGLAVLWKTQRNQEVQGLPSVKNWSEFRTLLLMKGIL